MKYFLLTLIIFLSLISCAKKNENTFQPPLSMDDTDYISDSSQVTYLALGDSYTIGSSVTAVESFPLQTAQLLKQQNFNMTVPEIIATNGWTTVNLLNALNTGPPGKKSYNIVTLLIGVNNQYQGGSLESYKTDFITLLTKAIVYAGNVKNHVFVLSIPDYSVTPFASGSDRQKIAHEIDMFNAANKLISLNAGVHYIDVTPISREAQNDPSLLARDGLHPSGSQYKKWTDLLVPAILNEIH